jgi:hypothetical protein
VVSAHLQVAGVLVAHREAVVLVEVVVDLDQEAAVLAAKETIPPAATPNLVVVDLGHQEAVLAAKETIPPAATPNLVVADLAAEVVVDLGHL